MMAIAWIIVGFFIAVFVALCSYAIKTSAEMDDNEGALEGDMQNTVNDINFKAHRHG